MSAAVAAIDAYQRWLSPYKGFRCAHDVLHGHGGCSGFGKRAFARYPTLFAFGMLQRRFEECKQAYLVLMASDDKREERRRRISSAAEGACDSCDVADACSGSIDGCDIGSCSN